MKDPIKWSAICLARDTFEPDLATFPVPAFELNNSLKKGGLCHVESF